MARIGMDIGGTQMRVAAFTDEGELLKRASIKNDHNLGPKDNLDRLMVIVDAWDIDYEGIGVGCPGPLDIAHGRILKAPNLAGWEYFEVVRYLEERSGHRVVLNNDANVAGLAEARVGAGAGQESVFFFTVSTGVGGAYIYRGEIVSGANSCAAEVFNMMVADDPWHRLGMNPGALEDHASGTALGRMATEAFGRPMDARELFALDAASDARAHAIIDTAAENLARAVACVSFVVDPNSFVFGGSVALYNPHFIDLVHEHTAKYVLNPDTLKFALASCGEDAGLIGAALLV